jgi:fumarate hydratase subunit alpha/L(+)-tartrate dehydratase alpha subunit
LSAYGAIEPKLVAQTAKELYFRALKVLPPDVKAALARAAERERHPRAREILGVILLRSSVCHPIDRTNPQTNTGQRIPMIDVEFLEASGYVELKMMPKGSGSAPQIWL